MPGGFCWLLEADSLSPQRQWRAAHVLGRASGISLGIFFSLRTRNFSVHLLMIFASRNLDWSVCLNCDNCSSLATNSSAELTPSTGFQQSSHKRTLFVLKNSHCPAFVKSIIDLLQVPPDESEGWPEKPTSIMRKKSVEHKKTYHCDFRRLGPTQRLPPHACCTLIVPSFKTLSLL